MINSLVKELVEVVVEIPMVDLVNMEVVVH